MLSFKNKGSKAVVTRSDMERIYSKRPTIASHLPWKDYNKKHKCFLLEDNESLGVAFEIAPLACESRPEAMLEEISSSIKEAFKNSIPTEKENPWICQVYIKKESDLSCAYHAIESYFSEEQKNTSLTNAYLTNLKEHFEYVSRENGIFHDTQVTNLAFRGGIVRVYVVLYRRTHHQKNKKNIRRTQLEEMIRISRKFSDQLRSTGIRIKRMNDTDFYQWLVRWFNPNPKIAQGNVTDLLQKIPYQTNDQKPPGSDLTEQLFFSAPESFDEGWLFDGLPHKLITIQNMTTNPVIGHISAERRRNVDDKVFNLVDQLPDESVFVMTIVMQAQTEVGIHLKTIHGSAVGRHAQASKVKHEIEIAEKALADGDFLFPVSMGVYLKGSSIEDLHDKEAQVEVLLNSNGFKTISDDELFPVDAYLRYLPMCYDFHFDKQYLHRSRYILMSDIAKLLPFYGRSRGTGNPGMVFFNRGGEPWTYDLMEDKTKNAHLLVLGETGTGKSNLLNFIITHDLALYNSRFFIIDAGGSFDLFGDYCKAHGLTVNKIKIDPKHPVSLNPFANGLSIIEQLEAFNPELRQTFVAETCEKLIKEEIENHNVNNSNELDEGSRDILGDMVLATIIMITGGEKREEEAIRRTDRMLIMDAIIDAAYFVKDQQRSQMIASDIVDAFDRVALRLDPNRDAEKILRARNMADSMRYFTKDPVSSQFFNTYGNPWELADVTIIDFGLFAGEAYEAHRAIAFAGCMNKIISLAEANQRSSRSIKVVCDENHIFSSLPALAAIQTRVAKMGRKLGLWLWLATQNMKDFAEGARRMLSQIETWLCLALPPDEIEQIERFKTLTDEERALFLSARKEKGKYTEGVLLSPKMKGLIRNVPPRLYLAMAATDQDEKNLRARMMKECNCSEIEAVKIIAKNMMAPQKSDSYDD